jgi:hypothetical protein
MSEPVKAVDLTDLDEFLGRQSKQSCESLNVAEISHKRLKDITVKHILDSFKQIGQTSEEESQRNSLRFSNTEQASWAINVNDVHRLIRLCGGDLDKFESFYLLKRSNYGSSCFVSYASTQITQETSFESTRTVSIGEFTDAIESLMNDVSMEAGTLIPYLFGLKFGTSETKLTMT